MTTTGARSRPWLTRPGTEKLGPGLARLGSILDSKGKPSSWMKHLYSANSKEATSKRSKRVNGDDARGGGKRLWAG